MYVTLIRNYDLESRHEEEKESRVERTTRAYWV